jgi:hypothetical protein
MICSVRCVLVSVDLVFQTDRGLQKVVSTVVFLYFACLLPSIAFGVLNSHATNDQISESDRSCIRQESRTCSNSCYFQACQKLLHLNVSVEYSFLFLLDNH